MSICTGNNYTQTIDPKECIGNSLSKINGNFKELDLKVCDLYNFIEAKISAYFTGTVSFFPSNTVPTGWLILDGAAHLKSTYANLWSFADNSDNIVRSNSLWIATSAVGSFCEVDSDTFRVPDLRGRFVRGFGTSAFTGVNSGDIGDVQEDEMASHSHLLTDPGHIHKQNHTIHISDAGSINNPAVPGDTGDVEFDRNNVGTQISIKKATTGITIAAFGGDETRPANVIMLPCIKT